MSNIITKEYLDQNYKRFNGFFGAIKMSSKKTSDIDAALWMLSHNLNTKNELDSCEDTFTYKAWVKRTSIDDRSKNILDPYIFETVDSDIFKTLLKHNIIAGGRNMFPTAFLRLTNPIVNNKSIAIYDISETLRYQTSNNRYLIIKSKTTEDIVLIKRSLDYVDVNDPYGFFIEMMDHPENTFKNKKFDKTEAIDIFNFLDIEKDLCIQRYVAWQLAYKVNEVFYQKPDFNTNLTLCIDKTKQFLSMFYSDVQIETSFLLYDLHNDYRQVLYNLSNIDTAITQTNELPTLM